ncbi:MAG: secondary thiamine-phosphate synthase enzyme YjbQ [Thermoleophilia bacterium]
MTDAKKSVAAVSGASSLAVYSREFEFPMQGELDIVNVTAEVAQAVHDSGLTDGIATVFVPGATGGVTCLEFEPGVVADFRDAIERLAPIDIPYEHNLLMADGNGHGHVRAGFLGPSLVVPFSGGELILGVWQQVVLVNCDNRARSRRLVVQVLGC